MLFKIGLMAKTKDKLTDKRKAFTKEYLIDLNASKAAERAGYSKKTAYAIANKLLKDPDVKVEVQKAMDERAEKTGVTAEKILKRLDDIGDLDIGEAYDKNGKLLSIKDMPVHVRKSISSIKVFEEFEGFGKDRISVGEVREVKFWDKIKSNELLGRHLKLFAEQLEVTDKTDYAGKLALARKRAASNK